jgi:hypothetical protein
VALEAGDDDEDSYAPIAYLSDPDKEPSLLLESEEAERGGAQGLKAALASLDERSRRIIEARWLREKDPATLHDLAAEFKVSAERIRQVEAKAMERVTERLLDLLVPTPKNWEPEDNTEETERRQRTRDKMKAKLEAGELEEKMVELFNLAYQFIDSPVHWQAIERLAGAICAVL